MPKTLTSIRSLARSHTEAALAVLAKIMQSEDATPAARVSAANSLLDRGWGKPSSIEDSVIKQIFQRIERTIVDPKIIHPENPDRPDL